MNNKVVLNFNSGNILKGIIEDFFPNKDFFHIKEYGTGKTFEIDISKLKGIFFVKTFEGDKKYTERQDKERRGLGKKIEVKFKDGESIVGYTTGYSRDRRGFFLFPSDSDWNTEKIFVVIDATDKIAFI
ncbi:MAG: hypothetical protein IT392_01220 [Nitrospirae bacterium]|nr:hypothetical protein [Nitrospirota bacterium]